MSVKGGRQAMALTCERLRETVVQLVSRPGIAQRTVELVAKLLGP